MTLGEKIRIKREAMGLSKYRLTEKTGISGQHIKYIEQGKRQPTIPTLERLADALNTSILELLSDDANCTYLSENEKRLIDAFRSLDNEKSDKLLSFLEAMIK